MGWFQRADYRWRLLADPPVCQSGRPEVALNSCDRMRRGEVCWCRFETQEAIEDVALLGAPGVLDDWLTVGDLDERDVEDLHDAIDKLVQRSRAASEAPPTDVAEASDRLERLEARLARLVDRGSGLSDRLDDEVD